MHFMYRLYQWILYLVSPLLPWREPKLFIGEHALDKLNDELRKHGVKHLLIVTDQGILKSGILDQVKNLLSEDFLVTVYDQTLPSPTISHVEQAYQMYQSQGCDAIIGLGGGSPIDAAKCVGIRVAKPHVPLHKMKGILKVRKKLPLLIAIPTTAGTGSEATLAAVISDPLTHAKFAISDMPLIPKIAVLDPLLTTGLPSFYTATTGMDALTHAMEAYLGKSNTKETKRRALHAIELIHKNLITAYDQPNHIEARMNMLLASYHAGYAFTRAYVGNIHAIAHTFGGFYNIPHGYANAIIMPHVLHYYGEKIYKKCATIYDVLYPDHAGNIQEKALKVIDWIEGLNHYFNIPKTINLNDLDHIDNMIERAYKEANPLYPVPVIFKKKDFANLYHLIAKKTPK